MTSRGLALALLGVIIAIAPGKINSLFFLGVIITIVGISFWWVALTKGWTKE